MSYKLYKAHEFLTTKGVPFTEAALVAALEAQEITIDRDGAVIVSPAANQRIPGAFGIGSAPGPSATVQERVRYAKSLEASLTHEREMIDSDDPPAAAQPRGYPDPNASAAEKAAFARSLAAQISPPPQPSKPSAPDDLAARVERARAEIAAIPRGTDAATLAIRKHLVDAVLMKHQLDK